MKIDLGEILRKKAIIFPALDKEPKKPPPSYGLFPEFTLTGEQLAESLEYRYPVSLISGSPAELGAMTDRAINAAKEPVDAGDFELWLYAAPHTAPLRIKGKPLFETRIIFVFRARRVYFASAEPPSGSIVEVPKEPTPEDLEENKANEEVKHG